MLGNRVAKAVLLTVELFIIYSYCCHASNLVHAMPWHAIYLHVRGTRTTRYRTGTMYLYPRDGYMYPNICTRVLEVNLEYRF